MTEAMHEIYDIVYDVSSNVKPGQMPLTVVSADAPPNKSLDEAEQKTVVLTLYDAEKDLDIKKEGGTVALRRHKICRLCREAYQQGGLLTVEDLANRLLGCGERTISRDLKHLRKQDNVPPLRSTIKDMGRAISHKEVVVEKWLQGKEYYEIADQTYHSISSVRNYVSKFKRTIALTNEGFDPEDIAFVTKMSVELVKSYQELYSHFSAVSHRQKELQALSKKKLQDKLKTKEKPIP